MATFLVDISGKLESVVWNNRLKNDSYEEFCIVGKPDFRFDINDVDPYSDSKWSGEKLKQWSDAIQKQFTECGKKIEKQILEQTRKNKFEDWMIPLLEMKQIETEAFSVLRDLVKMIDIAVKNNGTVIFIGD